MWNKKLMLLFVGLILMLSLATVRTEGAAAEEKYFEVGVLTDLTGPGSTLASTLFAWENLSEELNQKDYFGQGVKAKILWIDTKFEMSLALGAYERWRTRPKFVVQTTPLTHFAKALTSLCTEDKRPLVLSSYTNEVVRPAADLEWVYGFTPTHPDIFAEWIDFVLSSWKEARPLRVAIICYDVPWGYQLAQGGIQYAKKRGVEIVCHDFYKPGTLDYTIALRKVQAAKADYLYLMSQVGQNDIIAKDAARIGFTIPMVQHGTEAGNILIRGAGKAANGIWVTLIRAPVPLMPESELTPSLRKVLTVWNKYNPKLDFAVNENYGIAFPVALYTFDAIKKALADVGYEKLTGEVVKRYLDKAKDIDTWGYTPPITFTSKDRRGNGSIYMGRIENGLVVKKSDYLPNVAVNKERCFWSPYLTSGPWDEVKPK